MDSATEFLFGHNVNSLSAGIPYPPALEHKDPPAFANHSSNVFVRAFIEGQYLSVARTALSYEWPLMEFWQDRVAPFRKIMDNFTEPLMHEALEKREKCLIAQERGEKAIEDEDLSLLSHLVRHTQDPRVIKDELINLLVAGRDTVRRLLRS